MAIRKKQPAPSKKKPPAFDRPKRGGGKNTILPAPSKGGKPKLKKDGPKKDAPKKGGRTPIKGKPAVQPKKPGQKRYKPAVQPKQKRFNFKK